MEPILYAPRTRKRPRSCWAMRICWKRRGFCAGTWENPCVTGGACGQGTDHSRYRYRSRWRGGRTGAGAYRTCWGWPTVSVLVSSVVMPICIQLWREPYSSMWMMWKKGISLTKTNNIKSFCWYVWWLLLSVWKGKTVDWEYVFVIPFQFFALCITIHDASCAAFMDGAALVLQLCGSRSGHCCFRAGHVPSGTLTATLLIRSSVKVCAL